MLTLRTHDSFDVLENFLSKLYKSNSAEDLELARSPQDFLPGREAALIQSILTWTMRCRTLSRPARLVTQMQANVPAHHMLDQMAASTFGLAALLSATSIHRQNLGDITDEARVLAAATYMQLLPLQFCGDPRTVSLMLHDKHPNSVQLMPFAHLSIEDGREDREESFVRVIAVLLDKLYNRCGAALFKSRERNEIPDIVYQLFANAEEWGSTKLNTATVDIPLRGTIIRVHKLADVATTKRADPLSHYFRSIQKRQPTASHLLEISVFDGGIGLAQRFAKKAFTDASPIQSELKAMLECWRLHKTTSSRTGRGLGLFGIMRSLTRLEGFIRLRTGRLHLFRNFLEEPHPLADQKTWEVYLAKGSDPQFEYFRDWATADTRPSPVPYAKGALFTLILAMKEAQTRFPLNDEKS